MRGLCEACCGVLMPCTIVESPLAAHSCLHACDPWHHLHAQLRSDESKAAGAEPQLWLCRVNDTSQQWDEFRFAPTNSIGVYQPTTGQKAALYPQLANTTTFIAPLARDFYPQQFARFNHAQVSLLLWCVLMVAAWETSMHYREISSGGGQMQVPAGTAQTKLCLHAVCITHVCTYRIT